MLNIYKRAFLFGGGGVYIANMMVSFRRENKRE